MENIDESFYSKEEQELFFSGGVSGAITNAYGKRADRHAKRFYKATRRKKGDYIVRIARNTGYTFDQISAIKSYLFIEEHELEDGKIDQFYPSFYISESWRRLAYAPEHIQPHDMLLLKHELREMELVHQGGMSQSDAHDLTEKDFNYAREAKKFHDRLRPRHNHLKETSVNHTR